MHFTPRTDELLALPSNINLEAVIAMSPENFCYASGAYILTVEYIRPRQAFAVLAKDKDPFVLICSIEESLTRDESWIDDIRTYVEFADNPIDRLVAELKREGITSGRVGIDLDYLPVSSYQRLIQALPDIEFVDTTQAIAAIRAVKTRTEVDILTRTTQITHQAVLDAMEMSQLGDSEYDMASKIATNMLRTGADGTLFMCFGTGDRTAHPHTMASPDVIPQAHDLIKFDVGGTFGAFASDFARTYSAGEPTDLQKQTYRALAKIQRETIEAIRPGMTAEDLFYFCKEGFAKNGIAFHMPHIGHSFGVELHENPMLRPGDKTQLVPGMVVNIEPLAKDELGNGYHLEDLVLITDTGAQLLSLGLAPAEIPVIGQKIKY